MSSAATLTRVFIYQFALKTMPNDFIFPLPWSGAQSLTRRLDTPYPMRWPADERAATASTRADSITKTWSVS
jgi:hypothetical protein